MNRYFQPRSMPESNAPFTQVVIDHSYAHLAGIVAADFPEGLLVLGDVGGETRAVLAAVRNILAEIDLQMDRIVRVEVHLADLDDFDAMDWGGENVYDVYSLSTMRALDDTYYNEW